MPSKSSGKPNCLRVLHLTITCRLERLAEDPQQRTFEWSNDNSEEFVVNSTELRLTSIEMDKYIVGSIGPAVRRSSRPSARARSRLNNQHIKKKYILPIEIEQCILKHCYE